MPQETFRHTAVAPAAIEKVWDELDKPHTWESIGGIDRVVDPVIDSKGRLTCFSFDTIVAGKAYRGEATSKARQEGTLMAWNVENSEMSGVTTVALSPDGPNTSVQVTVLVMSKGFISSLFFPVVSRTIGTGLAHSVEKFAANFGGSSA